MQRRRIVVAAAILTAVGAAVAFTLPSNAGTTPSGGAGARSNAAKAGAVSPALLAAMQRDLGLSADEARAQIARQQWAGKVSAKLSSEAGEAWAGSWLGKDGTTLNVAVTESSLSDGIRDAGAKPTIVAHSARQLDSVKASLDSAATDANQDLPGWFVDVATNQVVLLAPPGRAAEARRLAVRAGAPAETLTVKTSTAKPKTLAAVRGGDPYFIDINGEQGRCSIGFAVVGGFVTAGHCGAKGTETADFAQGDQGVVKASVFPGAADFGFVATGNDETLLPVVNDFKGGELSVAGAEVVPVGSAVCRSGSTTGLRCGRILSKNETVNYAEGSVTGLTRTDACAEGGDSGGSWTSGDQAQGVTSGGFGDCVEGGETFFQPLLEILQKNNLTLITTKNSISR